MDEHDRRERFDFEDPMDEAEIDRPVGIGRVMLEISESTAAIADTHSRHHDLFDQIDSLLDRIETNQLGLPKER